MLTDVPGLRKLKDFERVTCGSEFTPGPCTREQALQYVLRTWPVSQSFQTPNYSNQAFQILAYAVEKITGMPFPDIITEQLIEPLNLTRTFVTNPDDESNAVIEAGWGLDFGDNAP
jgi:CubicO group peptidase (beta-lactamase class C family)